MIEFASAILIGIAAHQTDKVIKDFRGGWEYIARYIVGGLAVIMVYALMLSRLNRAAMRDGILAIVGAFGGVGIGVSVARLYDEVK